jgi:hypothetical protein
VENSSRNTTGVSTITRAERRSAETVEAGKRDEIIACAEQQVGRMLLDDHGDAAADVERRRDDVVSRHGGAATRWTK